MAEQICLQCGKSFKLKYIGYKQKFCSRKCRDVAHTGTHFNHTEESKNNISIAQISKARPHVGVPRSEETRKKISNTRLLRKIKHTPETIEQMKLDRKGKPSPKKGLPGHKHTQEAKDAISKALSGENSHLWKGGISFAPYTPEFNNRLKEEIRDRDNHICQGKDCGVPEIECVEKLLIHHIDYNKENCNEVNLISLCRKCHGKTNTNRTYWENYFTKVMISKIHIKE